MSGEIAEAILIGGTLLIIFWRFYKAIKTLDLDELSTANRNPEEEVKVGDVCLRPTKDVASAMKPNNATAMQQPRLIKIDKNTKYRCVCEQGFLPSGLLGNNLRCVETVVAMGVGKCYHKQR